MKIITIDVEEWFHVLYLNSTEENRWNRFESRLDIGMNELFDVLEKNAIKATFFCLGSVAKKRPSVIQKISNAGHEIASHGFLHDLIPKKQSTKFSNDLRESIDMLEQITGKKIISYRAPGFSITKENLWVFEVLLESGIQRDSSIIIGKSYHGGMPEFKDNIPFQFKVNRGIIKEFPINTFGFLGYRIIFGGGGYFRFFPYYLIKKWTTKSNYAMAYFHYRDFDKGQPILKSINLFEKFRAYYGINYSLQKLNCYVKDFNFISIDRADKNIDWSKSKTINLKDYFQGL